MVSLTIWFFSFFSFSIAHALLFSILFIPLLVGRPSRTPRPAQKKPVFSKPLPPTSRLVSITTEDGYVLKGVFTRREKAKGTVLLCHPATYNKEYMTDYEQHLFHSYNCFRFDFRRHGELAHQSSVSTGKKACCTLGKKEVLDIQAAISYIKSLPEAEHLPLYGFGISMGGVALIQDQALHQQFDALILQAPFDTLNNQVKRHRSIFTLPPFHFFLFKEPGRWIVQKKYGIHLSHVSPLESIAKIEKPIFIIHSEDDRLIPVRVCSRLKKAAKKCTFFKSWTPRRGGHTGTFRLFPEKYKRKCLAFLEKVTSLSSLDKGSVVVENS